MTGNISLAVRLVLRLAAVVHKSIQSTLSCEATQSAARYVCKTSKPMSLHMCPGEQGITEYRFRECMSDGDIL